MIACIIADVLGKENNGTTVACMNLVRYLKSQGDVVRIVCCDQEKKGEENYYVVPTLNLGCIINAALKRNEVSLAKADKKILESAIKGSDIVHIMMPFALGKKAVKIANELNVPVTAGFHMQAECFTAHIFMMNSKLVNLLTYKNFYNKLYKNVDAIHYPTQFAKDTFEKAIKKETQGYIISNGVNDRFVKRNVKKPKELENKFVILYTGRYSQEKKHEVLVKAIAKSKYKDNIHLVLAGAGPKEKEIRKIVRKNKISATLNFYNRDDLVDVINYADLYCHPSEIEIEGIACLEALKCGVVPVVANSSRCATKYFAIDDKNLFKLNDSKNLAEKIDFWIENPDLKEEYKEKYLNTTTIYNQTECMIAMRKMLLEVMEKHNDR